LHLKNHELRRSDMSDNQAELVQTLKRLQSTADRCADSFSSSQLKVEYRVAFSAGARYPWRLVEIHHAIKKAGAPRSLRRMHCFQSWQSLYVSIRERITWRARDQALVRSYLVRVGGPGADSLAGEVRRTHSNADLSALTATRQALRAQMCSTRADRAIDLPKMRPLA
jgi:hypothetical protein